MTVKIIAENDIARKVSIECTPTEYLTIKIALQHLANIGVNDVIYAKQIIDEEQFAMIVAESENKNDP